MTTTEGSTLLKNQVISHTLTERERTLLRWGLDYLLPSLNETDTHTAEALLDGLQVAGEVVFR